MKYSWIPIIFLFLFISCSKDSSPSGPSTSSSVIIPMKVGYSWTYHVYHYSSNGTVVDSSQTATLIVTADSIFGGIHWYNSAAWGWATNKSDGFWQRDDQGNQYLIYRYPYSDTDTYAVSPTLNCKLESTHDTIKVGLAKYSCYLYHFMMNPANGGLTVHREFIQPNVGLIRYEIWNTSGAGYMEYRLQLMYTSFH